MVRTVNWDEEVTVNGATSTHGKLSSLEQVEDNFHVGADTQTFSPCSKVQLGILLKRNDLPMI